MQNPFLVPSLCAEWYYTEPNISSLDFAMSESSWSEYIVLHSRGPLLGWIIWTQQRGFCRLFIQTQMPEDMTSSLVKQLPTSQRYMLLTTSRDERSNSSNNLAQWWKHHRIYYVCCFMHYVSTVFQFAMQLITQLSFVILCGSFVSVLRLNLTKTNQL